MLGGCILNASMHMSVHMLDSLASRFREDKITTIRDVHRKVRDFCQGFRTVRGRDSI